MAGMRRFSLIIFALYIVSAHASLAADFQKGMQAYRQKDYGTALIEWRALADQGDANARHNLGVMYASGQGVVKDQKIAVKWFTLAARQGLAKAQLSLGLRYASGIGVALDEKTAAKWLTQAAKNGHVWAQVNLGVMHTRGQGVAKDKETAVK